MAKIVVGVDSSGGESHALVRAVREARLRDAHLEIISVWTFPPLSMEEKLMVSAGQMERETQQIVGERVAEVMSDNGISELSTNVRVVEGAPARVLVAASEDADLLVVGRHDRARVRHFLIGSVASQCVRHATCPTMVVPGATESPPRIVVGMDGSQNSHEALQWALAQAKLTGADVEIFNVWHEPLTAAGELMDPLPVMEMCEESARESVDAWVADARVPDGVTLTGTAAHGDASHILAQEGETADLVVIGSRGVGGFAGLLLGSVSRNVVHLSPCTVVVIPHTET